MVHGYLPISEEYLLLAFLVTSQVSIKAKLKLEWYITVIHTEYMYYNIVINISTRSRDWVEHGMRDTWRN